LGLSQSEEAGKRILRACGDRSCSFGFGAAVTHVFPHVVSEIGFAIDGYLFNGGLAVRLFRHGLSNRLSNSGLGLSNRFLSNGAAFRLSQDVAGGLEPRLPAYGWAGLARPVLGVAEDAARGVHTPL
jgi:hypothetical protein